MTIKYFTDPPDSTDYGVTFMEQPARKGRFGEESYTRVVKAIVPIAPGSGGEHYGPVVVGNELRRQHGIYKGCQYLLPSGETSTTVYCTDIVVDQTPEGDNQNVYTVTIEYGAPSWGAATNPLLVPPTYGWTSESMDIPLWMDFDPSGSKPICNSAGDLFDDPVRTPYNRRVLTVRRNEVGFSAIAAGLLENKCNGDTWNGWAPYTVLCRSINSEHINDQSIAGGFDEVTYTMVFDGVMGHVLRRADAGWQEFDGTDRKRITNSDGSDPTDVPLLDGNGGKLADGDDTVVLEFYPYDIVSFGTAFPWMVI